MRCAVPPGALINAIDASLLDAMVAHMNCPTRKVLTSAFCSAVMQSESEDRRSPVVLARRFQKSRLLPRAGCLEFAAARLALLGRAGGRNGDERAALERSWRGKGDIGHIARLTGEREILP